MSQTKQEIRQAWDKNNMQRYMVRLHKEHNKDLIDYVEHLKKSGFQTSEIFKDAISTLMNKKE